MKYLINILAILFGLVIMESCYYDNPPEPLPIDPDLVSFDTHIVPILNKSCSTANCHDGTREPDLRADVAWANLQAGGYVNLTLPRESSLYKSVEWLQGGDPMPPGGPQLPEKDRDLILAWVIKGALND